MILSIASGKGGTGKTTIATNLAYSIGKRVRLLDCDVEEPNSNLFLKAELKEKETVYTPVPKVDMTKCTLCRKCADVCRFSAITVVGKKVLIFPEICHSCGGCIIACPENAFTEEGRELGIQEKGRSGHIDFVHGKLRISEAMSPPLIKQVRSNIKSDEINIIDAPPGTSCPAISSIKNSDFVLMVTEPTPFGLHDLILAVEAVKLLNIPAGIVINRAGAGNDKVKDYAESENIPVLMEIPFDRKMAEIYSRGELIVKSLPEWLSRFHELYIKIEKIVHEGRK